jgi:hypothetical protein
MQLVAPPIAFRPPPRLAGFTDAIARIGAARDLVGAARYGVATFQLNKALGAVSYGAMLLNPIEHTYENVNRFIHASQDIGFAIAHLAHLQHLAPGETDPGNHLAGANAMLDEAELLLRELPSQ